MTKKLKDVITTRLCIVALGVVCGLGAGNIVKAECKQSDVSQTVAMEREHAAPSPITKTGTDDIVAYDCTFVVADDL